MRFGRSVRVLVVVLAVMVIGVFSACDSNGAGGGSGGTGTGSLTVGGQTYSLSKMYTADFGETFLGSGVYNIDIYLISEGLTLTGLPSGIGEVVYLEMFFSTPTISAGTFNFSEDFDPPANTFSDYSDIEVRWQPGPDISEDWWELSGGVVTISISGSTYTINGTVDLDGGGTATFSYSGRVTGEI